MWPKVSKILPNLVTLDTNRLRWVVQRIGTDRFIEIVVYT